MRTLLTTWQAGIPVGVVAVLLALGAGTAGAADSAARITASVGSATSGDQALEMRGDLEEGAAIETADDGSLAMLVDMDALCEVCASTALRLERKEGKPDGPRVVNLDRGEIRLVVEPRLGEERIEIHTPAAIATILGTVVFVSVDALGVTTITADITADSPDSKVLVEHQDKSKQGSLTLDGGEQVVVDPREDVPKKAKYVAPDVRSAMGGCDVDFHGEAIGHDSRAAANNRIEAVVEQDIAEATLPQVAAAIGESQVIQTQVNPPPEPNTDPPTTPVDTIALTVELTEPTEPGGDCPPGGPPVGDHCG
jgi:hypothetical protein